MTAKQKRPATAKQTREAIARRECVECAGALEVTGEDTVHQERGLECKKCKRRYLEAYGAKSPSFRE